LLELGTFLATNTILALLLSSSKSSVTLPLQRATPNPVVLMTEVWSGLDSDG